MPDWRPRPAPDLPERLILFDGDCVLCTGWVRFIIARDPEGLFRFVSIQSEPGRALAARFGIDAEAPQSNVVIRNGRAWFKGDSALQALRDLPRWRWLTILRLLPRGLRDGAYDFIARNRYRWFGRHAACLMPTPEIRARLIERLDQLPARPPSPA